MPFQNDLVYGYFLIPECLIDKQYPGEKGLGDDRTGLLFSITANC